MKVLFVSDHFSTPDQPGILRTWQLAKHLCEQGDEVTVIAPETHYLFAAGATRRAPLPARLTLVPLSCPTLDRSRTSSRLRYYFSQLLGATVETWKAGRADVVVAGQTPSMLAIGAYLVARARRAPFVLDERDLALAAAAELGLLPSAVIAVAARVESFLHRHADAVLAVTPGVRDKLRARGVASERLWLVPNGFDAVGDGHAPGRDVLRAELGWDDKVVLLYAGGLGRAYDLDPVLDALGALGSHEVLLAVVGEGERKADYRRRAAAQHLPVQFLDPRPKDEIAAICRAADIAVLPLAPISWSACSLSNKFFDYLGSGLPVIATGPGDTADLLVQAGAGLVVPPGDAEATASAIATLVADPEARAAMGSAGQRFVNANWRRERFAARFRQALQAVAAGDQVSGTTGEAERIRRVYERYDTEPGEQAKRSLANPGVRAMAEARWEAMAAALGRLPVGDQPRVLDVGCGGGSDLRRIGELWSSRSPRLHGIDLLPDRIARAREIVPGADLKVGSAEHLPFPDRHFDLVLASTVFSSILDPGIARAVAAELLRVLAPGGVIVCYDVRLPNPTNPNTRAITRRVLGQLFDGAQVSVRSVTLLPPLARRLGRFAQLLYRPLQTVPPLRSHCLAAIRKPLRASAGSGGLGDAGAAIRPRILAVVPADARFTHMTVNQRLRALARLGDVDVLSCHPKSFPPDVAQATNVRGAFLSSRLPRGTPRLVGFGVEAAVWSLMRRVGGQRYALSYCFQDLSAVAGWILRCPEAGWVIDAVDDPGLELRNAAASGRTLKALALGVRDQLFCAVVRRADAVLTIGACPEDPLPRLLASRYRVNAERITPLSQALDLEAFPYAGPPPARGCRIFYVGWVSPLRGVDTLLAAAHVLASSGYRLQLRLAGHLKNDDRGWLARAEASGGAEVHYLGVLSSEAVLAEMRAANICVCPFPDGPELRPVQPVKVLEYMAAGRPVVASRLPGIAAIVEHGVSGLLVEPSNVAAFVEALARLLDDPSLGDKMGGEGRRRVASFDTGRVNQHLAEVLAPWL